MPDLNDVSKTALITLRGRVIEAEKRNPLIHDEMGMRMLAGVQALPLDPAGKRLLDQRLPSTLTVHLALRARRYDAYVRSFLDENPDGLVVSLGCGFDTRYWRVSDRPWNYIEIDLQEVIEAKKQALGDRAEYRMIGCSVLEDEWMAEIRTIRNDQVLFLAEGLFMYLPVPGVRHIFKRLTEMFARSQIVFEVVHERYTRGLWKKVVESKMKRAFGSDAGSSYRFGIRKAEKIESFGSGLRVLEEWSYFEDDDIRPRILKLYRGSRLMTRAQWTIRAAIG